jgi:hypothetical protein
MVTFLQRSYNSIIQYCFTNMLNAYAGWEQEQDPGVFSEAAHCLEDIYYKNKFHCVALRFTSLFIL